MPAVLFIIIIGAAAGFLATRFMRVQTDVFTTIAIGIFGALLGWLALRLLLTVAGWTLWAVGAVAGAMALIWMWQTWGPKGRR